MQDQADRTFQGGAPGPPPAGGPVAQDGRREDQSGARGQVHVDDPVRRGEGAAEQPRPALGGDDQVQDREPDARRGRERPGSTVREAFRVRLQRDAQALDHPVHAALEIGADGAQSPNASTGGHVQTRLRSPYVLSIRATKGQNFPSRTQGAGNAPSSRLYGRSQCSAVTAETVWGALRRALFSSGILPSSMARI